MEISVRGYKEKDLPDMVRIWNEVVEDGIAFPQEEKLNLETGREFFASQTHKNSVGNKLYKVIMFAFGGIFDV